MSLPQFIHLFGPFGVSGLTVAGAAGAILGWLLVALAVRPARVGLDGAIEAALLPLFVGVLVGGRLANQMLAPDVRWNEPLTWLAITGTSLSFTGALLGGAVGAWWGMAGLAADRRWAVLDALAPGVCLAVAVGWLGLPAPGRLGGPLALPGTGVQPVQLYALVAFAALAAWLVRQWPRRDYPGQNAVTFVVLASALRFVLGFAEQAAPVLGPWSLTQIGDAATAVAGLALAAGLARRGVQR